MSRNEKRVSELGQSLSLLHLSDGAGESFAPRNDTSQDTVGDEVVCSSPTSTAIEPRDSTPDHEPSERERRSRLVLTTLTTISQSHITYECHECRTTQIYKASQMRKIYRDGKFPTVYGCVKCSKAIPGEQLASPPEGDFDIVDSISRNKIDLWLEPLAVVPSTIKASDVGIDDLIRAMRDLPSDSSADPAELVS